MIASKNLCGRRVSEMNSEVKQTTKSELSLVRTKQRKSLDEAARAQANEDEPNRDIEDGCCEKQ
jgi:heme/copper-type cytochrome/quinol oxidase subunit 2